ncbi:hypothetical protein A2U01_0067807, partial [Trifolium medium]|nr:hypothetical protein [Trifolium medium]
SVAIPDVTTTEGGQLDGVNTSPNDKNHDGDDSHQENDSESVAVQDARASDGQDVLKDTITPNSPVNLGGNMSVNTVVNPQGDESMKTVTEEIDDGASPGKQTGTKD